MKKGRASAEIGKKEGRASAEIGKKEGRASAAFGETGIGKLVRGFGTDAPLSKHDPE